MEDEKQQTTPPAWLNKDFIARALGAGGEGSTITVMSFDIASATTVGDSYLSDMYRITAKLENSKQCRMIVKCHPQGGAREDIVHNFNAFDKESRMLAETLPTMHKILEKATAEQCQPLAAKCFYYGDDPIKFIVLEDLRESGFTMAKRQQGLDLAHCILAVKTLARFHAASVALHDQDPAAIEHFGESAYREESRKETQPFVENCIKCLADAVSSWPGYENYAHKLKDMTETFFDRLVEVCKRKDDELNVLIHCDTWVNNMMFRYSGDVLQDMRLVDFQLCHYSCPALDLHFLHSCPRDDVRKNQMDYLIQEYHTAFIDTLRSMGISRHIISLQELQEKFKERAFFGFIITVCVLPLVLLNTEDGFDFEKTMSEDYDAVQENRNLYSNKTYVQTMKRLLPIFEQNGVL